MLIKAYLVQSHRIPPIGLGGPSPEPRPVGIVQFTGDNDQGRTDDGRKEAAKEILLYHSPLADHPAFGYLTWQTELISVDTAELGLVSVDKADEGFRIWLH
jgi:hypothetical protein